MVFHRIASVFIDPCGCGVRESDGFGGTWGGQRGGKGQDVGFMSLAGNLWERCTILLKTGKMVRRLALSLKTYDYDHEDPPGIVTFDIVYLKSWFRWISFNYRVPLGFGSIVGGLDHVNPVIRLPIEHGISQVIRLVRGIVGINRYDLDALPSSLLGDSGSQEL
ncbi:hypothetical protein Tco_0913303 [Tanacetum coccineum]